MQGAVSGPALSLKHFVSESWAKELHDSQNISRVRCMPLDQQTQTPPARQCDQVGLSRQFLWTPRGVHIGEEEQEGHRRARWEAISKARVVDCLQGFCGGQWTGLVRLGCDKDRTGMTPSFWLTSPG